MREFLVRLKDEKVSLCVEAENVKITEDGTAVFFNERVNLINPNESYEEVVAAFTKDAYLYFEEID
jgi:hypothetical protein